MITSSDIEAAPSQPVATVPAATPTAPPPSPVVPSGVYADLPVSNIRSVIAKRLLQSKQVGTINLKNFF